MGQPGLVVPVSGPYTGTWNALPLGVLSDDGYELVATCQGQEVNETDAYGLTLVEGIYRGHNWRMRTRGLEWNRTGQLALLQMFNPAATPGALGESLNPILSTVGQRWTFFCQSLILTSVLGAYPPSTPTTLTASNAGLAPNAQSGPMQFTSKVRELPLEMVLIPYQTSPGTGAINVPFTTT
jgi:hypothetical protein